jgi:predicted peptidase
MMTRREAIAALGSMAVGTLIVPSIQGDSTPSLAPGAPNSPERQALINAFRSASEKIPEKFEARTHKSDWTMPYRLFRPNVTGRLPLVVYLHGSGGLGSDNAKQMGLGNIFGTRVWALPENQKEFPCYVVVPQTDRGWVRYGPPAAADSESPVIPGLGDGARVAFEVIDELAKEFPIDKQRIYLTGQSMGGSGAWHMIAQRPKFFAAAVICCGGVALDSAAAAVSTPLWNFHGDADDTVPVKLSRDRIAALRKAGGHPLSTEYAGVGHNVWQWAYTEPSLVRWMFSKRRSA